MDRRLYPTGMEEVEREREKPDRYEILETLQQLIPRSTSKGLEDALWNVYRNVKGKLEEKEFGSQG